MRPDHHSTAAKPTRAYVLHGDLKTTKARRLADLALAEAVALAAALPGLQVIGSEVARLSRLHPGVLFGTGKVEDLAVRLRALEIDLVLVDGSVTPVQQRNLEKAWGVKLLDRTGLILEIFADRARTREGVLQVELAALSYQRTRLVRAWTHLERQRGGFGFVGGPGETQIESDRRAIDDQIIRLKRQLDRVGKTRALHRAARRKVPFPLIALVGYTNAGKSTLFNALTGAEVLAQDMLFATLDPTMRGVTLPDAGGEGGGTGGGNGDSAGDSNGHGNGHFGGGGGGAGRKVIVSDTVGFISDLPTQLVAAFRATLEEVLEADLILHVRDISHPETAEQAADVADILAALGVSADVPMIEVWNKLDLVAPQQLDGVLVQAANRAGVFAVSALTGAGMADLLAAMALAFDEVKVVADLAVSFADGRRYAWLHSQSVVQSEVMGDDGWHITVRWTPRQAGQFAEL